MDNKDFNDIPLNDDDWLEKLLADSNYGDDILNDVTNAPVSSEDEELERIMKEALSDEWDLTETILNAEPISIYNDDYNEPAPQPREMPEDAHYPEYEDDEAYPDEDGTADEYDDHQDSNEPLRKVRPRKRNTYGLLGIPHFLSTVIWLVIAVSIGLSLGRLVWICAADVLAFGREDQSVTITISTSDDLDTITDKLYNTGLIHYKQLFRFYASLSNAEEKISAGTFELNTLFDYSALVKGMSASSSYRETITVTIPEGYTCAQIFALLEEKGVCSAADLEAYSMESDFSSYWFLEDMERGHKYALEGFLFPDTYEFYTNATPKSVFIKFLNNFNSIFTDDFKAQIDTLNQKYGTSYTLYDIMTVASMIEKESAGSGENYDISSVIYNRLHNTTEFPYLQIDATIVYALGGKKELTKEDLELDSPYNSYKNKGLPPTPICNPGKLAIQAALKPTDTRYYYYALDPSTGLHHFSKTYKEHQAFLNSLK